MLLFEPRAGNHKEIPLFTELYCTLLILPWKSSSIVKISQCPGHGNSVSWKWPLKTLNRDIEISVMTWGLNACTRMCTFLGVRMCSQCLIWSKAIHNRLVLMKLNAKWIAWFFQPLEIHSKNHKTKHFQCEFSLYNVILFCCSQELDSTRAAGTR